MRKWRKVLFIYPYEKLNKLSYNDLFPPLGLEYIATAVKDLVKEITIIDMRYEKEPISEFLYDVDVIGISINWPHQRKIALSLLDQIPQGVTVILGGIHVTENVQEYLETNTRIDIIVRGDGEDIARDIFSRKPLSEIDGISYRRSGKVVHNPSRTLPKVLELYPDRSLRRYSYQHRTPLGLSLGVDTVMSSKGCPFKCEFCTHRLNPLGELRRWSGRSAESVVEEIRSIPADIVVFSDDNFAVDMQRVEKICDLLIAQQVKKIFMVELRIEVAHHPEILKKMWKAGFRVLAYGIESAQDKTLQRMEKGFTIQEVKEAFKVLRNFNMIHAGYFIIGYIGEDEKDMLAISSFAHTLGLDFVIRSRLRALKYSPLREIVENTPEYYIGERGRVFSDRYPPSRISSITKRVVKDFYSPVQFIRIIKKLIRSIILTNPIFLKGFIVALIGILEGNFKRRLLYLE